VLGAGRGGERDRGSVCVCKGVWERENVCVSVGNAVILKIWFFLARFGECVKGA